MKVLVLRVGLSMAIIERLDFSSNLSRTFRVHPWNVSDIPSKGITSDFNGLKRISGME